MKIEGVLLKKGKEALFQARHPWIFSGAIDSFPSPFEEGHIYPVFSSQKQLLGHGYFKSQGSLCGRILSYGAEDPWDAITRHIDHALCLRDSLFSPHETNAYRLINAEGDFLPGLVIDQYADTLIVQSSTRGMDLLLKPITDYLFAKGRYRAICEKSTSSARLMEQLPLRTSVLQAEAPKKISILENGIHFTVNWQEGQKTGFFLDQRPMRALVRACAKGKRVLNCFSYTGGFSIYALKGGARHVTSLDCSAAALAHVEEHLLLNQIPSSSHTSIEADAFSFLREDPLDYDLIILDPPAFVKKKEEIQKGARGYLEINAQAIKKIKAGGLLLSCSCSHFIDEAHFTTLLFQAAKLAQRDVQLLHKATHPLDHPRSLFHKEGGYLKSILLSVM